MKHPNKMIERLMFRLLIINSNIETVSAHQRATPSFYVHAEHNDFECFHCPAIRSSD